MKPPTMIRGSYLAIVLSPQSKKELIDWWNKSVGIELLDRVIAHHVTLKYEPDETDLQNYDVGSQAQIKVTGYVANDKAQAVVVESETRSHNRNPHITVSVRRDIMPVYSNELLNNKSPIKCDGPILSGEIQHLLPSRLHDDLNNKYKSFDLFMEELNLLFESVELKIKEIEFNGTRIIIGKNATANEHIVKNIVEPNDLWFHAKDFSGSHVVLKGSENDDAIQEAAKHAAMNSKGKNESQVTVVMCKGSDLIKTNDMQVGEVDAKNVKEIVVSLGI